MDIWIVFLVGWVPSAILGVVLVRRRGYEGGLAICLALFAAFGGPTALAFFLPWGGSRQRRHGARGIHTEGDESSNGTASMPR